MPPENPEFSLKQIRTFQGDVADALKTQEESLVSIQQAEHAKRGFVGPAEASAKRASLEPAEKKKFYFLLGTLMLLAVGALGIWYSYIVFITQTAVPVVTTLGGKFFRADSEKEFGITAIKRLDFIKVFSEAVANVSPDKTEHFIFTTTDSVGTERALSTGELFDILDSRAPGALVRAFDPSHMSGSIGTSAFLIIKLTSFENAFAGMLNWEKDMAVDIGPLFATREYLRDISSTSVLIDVTDRNKDVRLLAVGDQNILLYSFFDNNMLIITDRLETLRILVERLTREKLSR